MAQTDPSLHAAELQTLLEQGAGKAESAFQKSQANEAKAALDYAFKSEQARAQLLQSLESLVQGTRNQIQSSQLSFQQAKAQEQAKAREKQAGPAELVDQALQGTETTSFRTQAPLSTGPSDAAGGEAIRALVAGGRLPQQAGPVSGLRQGAGPGEALGAALNLGPSAAGATAAPAGGGGGTINVGGQPYAVPDELVRQVREEGVRPYQRPMGLLMAPHATTTTIREPNVLSAAQAADLQMRQKNLGLELGLKLYQDSEGIPADVAIQVGESLINGGDPQQLSAIGKQYPSLSRAAARASITRDVQLTRESMARSRLLDAEARVKELMAEGATSGWSGFFSVGGGGLPSAVDMGKVNPSEIWNDRSKELDPVTWELFQRHQAGFGHIYYKTKPGFVQQLPGMGGAPPINSITAPRFLTLYAVSKNGRLPPEQRALAIAELEKLPFMKVEEGRRPGDLPQVFFDTEGDNAGAARLAMASAARLEQFVQAGIPIPAFVFDESAVPPAPPPAELVQPKPEGAPTQGRAPTPEEAAVYGALGRVGETVAAGAKAAGQAVSLTTPSPTLPSAPPYSGGGGSAIQGLGSILPPSKSDKPSRPPPNPNAPRLRGRQRKE